MTIILLLISSLLYYCLYKYRSLSSLQGGNYLLFFSKTAAVLSSLLFLSLAVSTIAREEVENYKPRNTLFLVIDTSMSMGVNDTAGQKTRFSVAKEIANSLIDKAKGIPVAVVAYQNNAQYLVPPTLDHFYVKNCIEELPINCLESPGTNFKALFSFCSDHILEDPRNKNALFVLLTDGEDATEQSLSDIEKPLMGMVKQGATLCAVAIGSPQGKEVPGTTHVSHINEKFLQDIVTKAHGTLFVDQRAKSISVSDYFKTYESIPPAPQESFTEVYVGISLFFFVLFLFIPEVVTKAALLVLIASCPLQGNESLQTGFSYFEAGYYQLARNVFQQAFDASSRSALRAELLTNIGLCYCYEGKFEEAKNAFQGIDQDTFVSQEAKEKYFEAFALTLIKEAQLQLKEHKNQKVEELILQAKKYIELLANGQKGALNEELYLIDAAKIKEQCSLSDVEGMLLQSLGTSDEQIYREAVAAFLAWQGYENVPATTRELVLFIDTKMFQQEVKKAEDPIKRAVDLILDAKETLQVSKKPFWKDIQKMRTQLAFEIVSSSTVPYKKEAILMLQKDEIAVLRHYIDLFSKPLGELFALAIQGSDLLSIDVLKHKVQKASRMFLENGGQENIERAWIIEDAPQAFLYMLANDHKNLIASIEFAWQQKLLAGDPQLVISLYKKNKILGHDGALFFLVYERDRLSCKEWKDALQVLISFENKAAAEQEWDEDSFLLSLQHIKWIKNAVSESKYKSELDALLALEQSLGRDVPMQRYFHERAARVLEQIATHYQYESSPVEENEASTLQQESYENIFSRLQTMEQDEKEMFPYKGQEIKDSSW